MYFRRWSAFTYIFKVKIREMLKLYITHINLLAPELFF